MTAEDEARMLVRLLWRDPDPGTAVAGRRGPKPRVSVDEVVTSAIGLADAEGLAAVSMRALAARLGLGPMSLYTYVPTRDVLLALMVDQVAADTPVPVAGAVLESLDAMARVLREEYLAHPWLLEVSQWRQVLGPHRLQRYESQLQIIESVPMSDLARDHVIGALAAFVIGNARESIGARTAADSGLTDEDWWAVVGPALTSVMPPDRFPLSGRVGTAVGEHYRAPSDPDNGFDFGLARLLDGLRSTLGVH